MIYDNKRKCLARKTKENSIISIMEEPLLGSYDVLSTVFVDSHSVISTHENASVCTLIVKDSFCISK